MTDDDRIEQDSPVRPQVPVSRAGLGWEPPARTGAAPTAGASLLRRVAAEKARARAAGLAASVRGGAAIGGVVVVLTAVTVGAAGGWLAAAVVAVLGAAVLVGVLGWVTRSRWGCDSASRALRRRARRERTVAAGLDPLESAGWVVLHDRLVAAHRVPHLLVGPPGIVLLDDASLGALARTRGVGRRAAHLVGSVVRAVRWQPRRSQPVEVVDVDVHRPTADWARHHLRQLVDADPTLHGWQVVVYAHIAVLHRPSDRHLPAVDTHQVGYHDAGAVLRRHLEDEIPAGLTRPAVAYLATVVDEACPPA